MKDRRMNYLQVVEGGFRPWRRKGGTLAQVLSHLARMYDDRETYYVVTHEGRLPKTNASVSTFQRVTMKGVFDFEPNKGSKENLPLKWTRLEQTKSVIEG